MDHAVRCRNLENYQVHVTTDHHAWTIDEPGSVGGDDLGPNPFEALLGSLGACTLITVYHYAAQQEIPVEKLWTSVEGEWRGEGDEKTYHVQNTIHVRGDLSEQDLERLQRASLRCPVHGLLSEAAEIEVEVEAQ
jgi:putative redox protein